MKNQKLYPDLSYLEKAPKDSLAGRLVRPTLHTQKGREKEKRLATNEKRKADKLPTPSPGPTTETVKIKPPDVAAITQKRIEARLSKEKELAVRKGTHYALSTKSDII